MNAEDLIEQIKNSNDTFRKSQCRHTMPEGERCGSPAMHGEKFCYYHHETRKPVADPQLSQARRNAFLLPKPASRAAIQDALGRIISRIAYNDIDPPPSRTSPLRPPDRHHQPQRPPERRAQGH